MKQRESYFLSLLIVRKNNSAKKKFAKLGGLTASLPEFGFT
jgi:hypothetical protein